VPRRHFPTYVGEAALRSNGWGGASVSPMERNIKTKVLAPE
jgi:hypothetical protein